MRKQGRNAISANSLRLRVLAMSLVSTSMLILLGLPATLGYENLIPSAMPFLFGILAIWVGYYHVHTFWHQIESDNEHHHGA